MDLVTQTDLDALAARDLPGDHVSLFIPTHRSGAGVSTDRIRWKVLLKKTELALRQRGRRSPQIEELLLPAWALYEDILAWQYMSNGLALFIRPGWHRLYRVPAGVPEIATVGSRFVTGPLLRTMTEGSHFLVLVLSQRNVRLLEGSRQHVEEIELGPDIPTSLREVIEPPERRSETMARSTTSAVGGRAPRAIFYGHGAADEHFKKDEVRRFLRVVAKGLREYLHDQSLPMVLVGLDDLVSAYRGDVDVYPHVIDGDIRQSAEQLSAEQLHTRAWEVADAFFAQRVAADRQRFEELHGTGRASNDPREIEDAAVHGRIDTLFLAAEPWCWEDVSIEGSAVVQLGSGDAFAHCELLDRVATDTWSRGGHVHAIAASAVPGGGDVAAILRY